MESKFKQWLINHGYAENGAATSYSRAIQKISEHYSSENGENIDIYSITDQAKVSEISHDYSQAGKFSVFGYEQHSRFRNAIARYSEFFVSGTAEIPENIIEPQETISIEQEKINFAYERDLQTTLCAQISELFPSYRIFGAGNEGVEYSIEGRRIDVLLEHSQNGNLLAVELKSGEADYRVFGQISMYLGLLKQKFPNIHVSGVIVAGSIQDSLRQACEITDLVQLKIYRMSLELENA